MCIRNIFVSLIEKKNVYQKQYLNIPFLYDFKNNKSCILISIVYMIKVFDTFRKMPVKIISLF